MIFIIFNKIYFFLYWHTKIEDVPRITISITTCISGKAFCCGDKHFPIRHCRQNVTSSKAVVGPFIINFLESLETIKEDIFFFSSFILTLSAKWLHRKSLVTKVFSTTYVTLVSGPRK